MRKIVDTPKVARPEGSTLATPVRRVMVGTDRSETADQAVRWAASNHIRGVLKTALSRWRVLLVNRASLPVVSQFEISSAVFL
jgi:hypothetical protein